VSGPVTLGQDGFDFAIMNSSPDNQRVRKGSLGDHHDKKLRASHGSAMIMPIYSRC
jgi:hypothetical protein